MTTLIYNDVYLRDCETLSFEQTVQYDESGTDTLFSRFRIRVASSVVALRYPISSRQFGISHPTGATVVQKMHEIKTRLSQPRKDFWFIIESCPQDENTRTPTVIDQPLLIASGKAYDESITTTTSGSAATGINVVETLVRTDRMLRPHPGLGVEVDLTTSDYGPLNAEFPAKNVIDCDNGPKPKTVNVKKIVGGRSMRVEFEIEICRKFCQGNEGDPKPIVIGGLSDASANPNVLSNRWYLDESKDDNWVTTRTMQGTLRVANREVWAHSMRYLCIPGLLRGYKRTKQSFVTDAAGLTLKYRVEDQQAHAAPPYPAIKWSGRHTESGSGPNAMIKGGDFQIRLQGPPGCDKLALIGAAGKVAVDRIKGLRNLDGKNSTIMKNIAVMDVMDEPVIELRVQVQYTDPSYKALGLRIKEMGKPLTGLDPSGQDSGDDPYVIDGYKPDVWPVPLAYDSLEPAGVFNCYLQNPCSVWHGIPGGYNPESRPIAPGENPVPPDEKAGSPGDASGSNQGQEVFSVTGTYTAPDLPEDVSTIPTDDSDLYDFPYTFVDISQRYKIDRGWVSMPLASANESGSRTSSLIKLHAPSSTRILTMTASRNGKPPMIPALKEEQEDHNGNREVLSYIEIVSKAPETMTDGRSRMYHVELVCHYLLEKAPSLTDKLRGSSSPLDLFSPDKHVIDLASMADNEGRIQWDSDDTTSFPEV